jgi:hypothetical protein
MAADLQKIDNALPYKNGTIIIKTQGHGNVKKLETYVSNPTSPSGSINYDIRFDEVTYYG